MRDRLGRDSGLIEKDFALMTIAAGLVAEYGDALCFKGGLVLRHVHGHERFSKDIDATRINHRSSELVKAGDNRDRIEARVQRPMQGHGPLGERRVGPLRVCTRPTSLGR